MSLIGVVGCSDEAHSQYMVDIIRSKGMTPLLIDTDPDRNTFLLFPG